jgi:hypothetical protein
LIVTGAGVTEGGEFVPTGTIPTSSGRSEGVVRVGPDESDVAVRRVTALELVSVDAVQLNISVINTQALHKGRVLF